MPKLQLSVYQLNKLIEKYLPKIHDLFEVKEVSAELFCVQWFITIFSYDIRMPELCIIWDLFLLNGWEFVFKFSLSILYEIPPTATSMEPEDLVSFIKEILHNKSIQMIAKRALEIKFTSEELKQLEIEYKESFEEDDTEENKINLYFNDGYKLLKNPNNEDRITTNIMVAQIPRCTFAIGSKGITERTLVTEDQLKENFKETDIIINKNHNNYLELIKIIENNSESYKGKDKIS